MNIIDIDLQEEKKDLVRIGVVQLDLNEFFEKKEGLLVPKNHIIAKEKYFRFLNKAKELKVNIICFPELSLSPIILDELRDFADKSGIIIIGGSFYNKKRKNVCPIIIPNNQTFYNEKINLSPVGEESPYDDEGPIEGENLYVIKNSIFGSFGVLICADYVDDELKTEIFKKDIDVLFVVSLNNKSDDWHINMNQDCKKNRRGVYLVYSNSLIKNLANGKTAIFGLTHKNHLDPKLNYAVEYKFMEIIDENIIVADFNLTNKKPEERPNTIKVGNTLKPIYPYSTKAKKELQTFFNIIGLTEKRYKEIDELYVHPTNFNSICRKLKDKQIVFLIGDPEMGKTYTSYKLLLDYYKEGFVPIYHNELKSESIIEDRTAIYFEDPWGKTEFKSSEYIDIGDIIDRTSEVETRIIITTREKILQKLIERNETVEDLTEYVVKLKINRAYDKKRLKEMLNNYIEVFKPKWQDDIRFLNSAYSAIDDSILKTPMSVKKLIDKSKNVDDLQIFSNIIHLASDQTCLTFGREILTIFEDYEFEKIVFLSFPYISSTFDLEFIEEKFKEFLNFLNQKLSTFNTIASKDFKSLLTLFKEEEVVDVYSDGKFELLKYSHVSYEDGFSHALKNKGLFKEIFLTLLSELVDTSNPFIKISVANTIFKNLNKFPQVPYSILLNLSQDDNLDVKLVVGNIIFKHFDILQQKVEILLRNLVCDNQDPELHNLVCETISENFNKLSSFKEDLMLDLLYNEDSDVKITIGDIISENFEEFSSTPCDLLNKLIADWDPNVRLSVGNIIFENFEKFPNPPDELLKKLSEDRDINVKVVVGDKFAEHYEKFPEISKKYLKKLSEDLQPDVRASVGGVVAGNYHKFPNFAKQIIQKLASDNTEIKAAIANTVAINYPKFPNFAKQIIQKLASDENSDVRVSIANTIIVNYNEISEIAKIYLLRMSNDSKSDVRVAIGNTIAENFTNLPKISCQLSEKLAEDRDPNVRISAGTIIKYNFEKFPTTAINILIKLAKDKDIDVKISIGIKFAENFEKFPLLIEDYLKEISEFEDLKIRDLVCEMSKIIYLKNPIYLKNLIIEFANDDDEDHRMLACDLIKGIYEELKPLSEKLIISLSEDSDLNVRSLAKSLLFKKCDGYCPTIFKDIPTENNENFEIYSYDSHSYDYYSYTEDKKLFSDVDRELNNDGISDLQ